MMAMPTRISAPRNFFLWINMLSLDAPLVALVWQDFFSRALHVQLGVAPRALLGICAWLAYVADRWLDAWRIDDSATPRRRFAQKYRLPLACAWAVALIAGLILAWFGLAPNLFERGLILSGGVTAYFILNQWPGSSHLLRGFKEIAIAILFAWATLIFIFPQPALATLAIWWAAGIWCLLCFLDCYAISCWEVEADRAEKQESLVTRWPWLARCFQPAAVILVLLALGPLASPQFAGMRKIGVAVAMSATGLGVLDMLGATAALNWLRVCPDFLLLTPLLWRLFS
jgi:hypothetical protein